MQTSNTKLKVGVIGLGHQSLEDHIPAIKSSPDIELVGVVETDKEKLKQALRQALSEEKAKEQKLNFKQGEIKPGETVKF